MGIILSKRRLSNVVIIAMLFLCGEVRGVPINIHCPAPERLQVKHNKDGSYSYTGKTTGDIEEEITLENMDNGNLNKTGFLGVNATIWTGNPTIEIYCNYGVPNSRSYTLSGFVELPNIATAYNCTTPEGKCGPTLPINVKTCYLTCLSVLD